MSNVEGKLMHGQGRSGLWGWRHSVVAIVASFAVVATMFTASAPASAAGPNAFPDAPKDPAVEGALAPARPGSGKTKTTRTPVIAEQKGMTFTAPLDARDASAEEKDAGVTVRLAKGADAGEARVDVLDKKERDKLGGARYAVRITPSQKEKDLAVMLSPKAVGDLFGGDYASRLKWAAVPAAAADARSVEEAKPLTPEVTKEGLSFTVQGAQPMVLAAVSGATSSTGAGSYAASPLKPSSSWDVSAQTGAFSWSYPIAAPPAPAGSTPSVSLSYNSQIVDGATSSTNNQTSPVGEGWSLAGGGFIERRYVTCATEQAPGSPVAGSGDLCWANDNATISFGSRSGTLIRDAGTGKWRLQSDDNSRVEKLVGTAQGCAANGTYNTECWRLTTTDGTQYYFGLNRLPGWATGKPTTNSVFTVPVFGNDAADPCHAATFAASSCQQGWRWNLDYVVDPNGNAQALYYSPETNKYRLNNTTLTSYVRGGQLSRIEYGLTSSTVYSANAAPSRIVFDYDQKGRCNAANSSSCATLALGGEVATPATTSVYPDIPFDLNCSSGACTSMISPSFWTTARLASITTQSFTGGAYKTADVFTLTHSFPDPGDGESPALWLDSIQRTATAGMTPIAEGPTTFQKTPMQNRVWVVDGLAPLDKFRISSVFVPTGARISVNYSAQECTPAMAPGILASPWSNDKRCFPMWWIPDVDYPTQARQDLFHKYVVTSMVEDPYTGGAGSPAIQTSYVYTGKPAWRYVDDRYIPGEKRTWSDYAGYDKVEVRVGDPATPAQQETTQYLFYRGMNGDRAGASGGTKSVNVTGTSVPDERWFAGQTRSAKVLNGVGGATVSETVTTPWASAVTSNDGVRQARVLGVARTDVIVPVSTGGTRTTSTINTMNARGFAISTEKSAGIGQRATCTVTDYAADNTSAWIIGLPSVTTDYSVPCGQVPTASIPGAVVSHQQVAYDGGAVGAAASKGLMTAAWEASGFSGTTLGSAQWVKTSQFAYDALGRRTSSIDVAGRETKTAYTPAAGAPAGSGPVLKSEVTNPLGWVTSSTADPYRGQPVSATDDNGKVTTTEYDALGRITKVWKTDRPKSAYPTDPSIAYTYAVSTTKPSTVTARTQIANGTINAYALIDGLGRTVQTQAPAPGGGAVISDTAFDKAGRQIATNDQYWAPAVTAGTTLFVPAAVTQIAARAETVYDGAGRATATVLRSFGTEVRRTTTAYRGGDRIDTTPPAGGVPTSTTTDAWGRTTKMTEWHSVIDGTGSTSLRYEYNARDQMTRMTDDAGNAWSWSFDLRGRQTSSTDPDSGTTTSTFDDLGNVLTSTDARGTALGYTYDALNRKLTERSGSVAGTVLASWTYDSLAKGQLTSSSRYTDGKEYKTQVNGYDNAYRSTGATVSIPSGAPAFGGTSYSTSTYYNPDGSIAASVLPAIGGLPGEELYPSYDTLGMQSGLSGAANYASQVNYLATGQVSQITRSGTVWSALTLTYNAGTRDLQSLDETTRRGGTTFTREALREYTRNAAGIITKAKTSAPAHTDDVQCFSYGPLQAMTAAWSSGNADCATGPTGALGGPAPYAATYTVDPLTGNRTASTMKLGATGPVSTSTYTYPAAGAVRPHGVTQVSTTTGSSTANSAYQYDASGGMTKRAAQTVTYDQSGRLSSVVDGASTEKSIYSADGQLLIRYGGSDGASLFLGDTTVRTVGSTTTGIRVYSVAGITIAERTSGAGGGLWWLSPDPVGTVGLQINAATGAVTRRWMDPYGNPRGGASSWSSNLGFLNAPRSATGLTQLGARAYDPGLGKFTSVDPLLDRGDPRHANAYAYAWNSPVSYEDASGLAPRVESPDGRSHASTPLHAKGNPPPQPGDRIGRGPKAASAAGNDNSSVGSPGPKQEEQVWWNPGTWNGDTWRNVGAYVAGLTVAVVGTVVIVGGTACVVVTAGICALGAAVVASAAGSVVTYELSTNREDRTAEGYLRATTEGAVFGLAGGVAGMMLAKGLETLLAARGAASQTVPSGMSSVRAAGVDGEVAAGIVKNTTRIPSASRTAAYRIPDELNGTTLGEVKNVSSLSYTSQLKDFQAYAQQNGLTFNLYVRGTTTLSGPLQKAVDSGYINLIRSLPG
ncbi:putative toxin [Microbacterium sp.]|uniref:putative toxin n=1 Tax=Microbacterium sp. TaxID=51671 RepID=UPI00333FF776